MADILRDFKARGADFSDFIDNYKDDK